MKTKSLQLLALLLLACAFWWLGMDDTAAQYQRYQQAFDLDFPPQRQMLVPEGSPSANLAGASAQKAWRFTFRLSPQDFEELKKRLAAKGRSSDWQATDSDLALLNEDEAPAATKQDQGARPLMLELTLPGRSQPLIYFYRASAGMLDAVVSE